MIKIWYIDSLQNELKGKLIETLVDEISEIIFMCVPAIDETTNNQIVLVARDYTSKTLPETLSNNVYKVYEAVLEESLEYDVVVEVLLLQLLTTDTLEDKVNELLDIFIDKIDSVQMNLDEVTVEELDYETNILSELESVLKEVISDLDTGSYDLELLIEDMAYDFVSTGLYALQGVAESEYNEPQNLYEGFRTELELYISEIIDSICQPLIDNKKLYLKSINYELQPKE